MNERLRELLGLLFHAHPWHGVTAGPKAPELITGYIEIVPTDTVKYELDKASGLLRIDRPQRYSSVCPTLYGFIPQTYCGPRVADRCSQRTGKTGIEGDKDPLDLCVLTEKAIPKGGFLLTAHPIGGLRMVDGNEADDKILAVLDEDLVYDRVTDLSACPQGLIERLQHYFLSYKQLPDRAHRRVEIAEVYDRNEALEVIRRSMEDYAEKFGQPTGRIEELHRLFKA